MQVETLGLTEYHDNLMFPVGMEVDYVRVSGRSTNVGCSTMLDYNAEVILTMTQLVVVRLELIVDMFFYSVSVDQRAWAFVIHYYTATGTCISSANTTKS